MNYKLNDVQMHVLEQVSDKEMRTQEQMMSLLLAEAVRFYFCDHESPKGNPNHDLFETLLNKDAEDNAK